MYRVKHSLDVYLQKEKCFYTSLSAVFYKLNKISRLICFSLVGKIWVILFSSHSGNKQEKIWTERERKEEKGERGGVRRRGREGGKGQGGR